MARVTLTERERVAVAFRMSGVQVADNPTRRRVDRIYDALKLDELPADTMAKLNNPGTPWTPGAVEFQLTSDDRDNLLSWLEPTERYPMTGFMGRVLGPVYDELKDARDGKPAAPDIAPKEVAS